MADTLEIFGVEYPNATGIKATDDNGVVRAFIRPTGTKSISANGTGIDVSSYASVDVAVPSGTSSLQSKSVSYTPSETAQSQTVTADSGYDGLSQVTASVGAISSSYVGSGITRRDSSDIYQEDEYIVTPQGYYAEETWFQSSLGTQGTPTATKGTVSNHSVSVTPSVTNTAGWIFGGTISGTAVSVSASELVSGTLSITSSGTKDVTNYASVSVPEGSGNMVDDFWYETENGSFKCFWEVGCQITNAGYVDGDLLANQQYSFNAIPTGTTITPTTSAQTVGGENYMMEGAVTVAAMPTGTAGTPSATKGTVSNHSVSVTPSVTNTTGYITGGTKTGTAVTVSASELVSGTLSITSSGTKDVTNYASASVAAGTAGTPTATKGTVSNHSVSVTPSVTNTTGYITGGTQTGTAVTVSASELVSGSETKTANGTYDVTNLASLVVAVPIVTYYTGSSAPSSSTGSDGDIYLQTT